MAARSPLLFIIAQPSSAAAAMQLATGLKSHGIESWIGSLAPNGELASDAMAALQHASAVALLFDRDAAASREVDRHLLVARQEEKALIPIRLDQVDEGLLRQELLDADWIEGKSPTAFAQVAARVHRAAPIRLPAIPPAVSIAAPVAAPAKGSGSKALLAVGAFALLGILAILLFLTLRPSDNQNDIASAPTIAPSPTADTSDFEISQAEPSLPTVTRSEPRPEPEPEAPPPEADPRPLAPTAPGKALRSDLPVVAPPVRPVREAATSGYDPVGTARRFYSALSRGDGRSASGLVVPEKRASGAFSAAAMTRYYSSMQRPLRLLNLRSAGDTTVVADYEYTLRGGGNCRGTATISLIEANDGSARISSVQTRNGC